MKTPVDALWTPRAAPSAPNIIIVVSLAALFALSLSSQQLTPEEEKALKAKHRAALNDWRTTRELFDREVALGHKKRMGARDLYHTYLAQKAGLKADQLRIPDDPERPPLPEDVAIAGPAITPAHKCYVEVRWKVPTYWVVVPRAQVKQPCGDRVTIYPEPSTLRKEGELPKLFTIHEGVWYAWDGPWYDRDEKPVSTGFTLAVETRNFDPHVCTVELSGLKGLIVRKRESTGWNSLAYVYESVDIWGGTSSLQVLVCAFYDPPVWNR